MTEPSTPLKPYLKAYPLPFGDPRFSGVALQRTFRSLAHPSLKSWDRYVEIQGEALPSADLRYRAVLDRNGPSRATLV